RRRDRGVARARRSRSGARLRGLDGTLGDVSRRPLPRPHAHYRARDVRGFATLPDGSRRPLIDIPDWDFRWQHVYRFVTPMKLPKGTTVTMRYTYDNSAANTRNPQRPPLCARWGQRSPDEMGDLWQQVLPKDDRDLDVLSRDFRPKVAAEDVIGYETEIDR